MAKIVEGTMLSFSGGEWSDKWTNGPFEVIKEFDQQETVDAFRAQFQPEDEWDKPDESEFAAWLTLNNFIRDVPRSYNWYMGGYDFEPVIAADRAS
ncbi:hypothetical protein EHH54_39395 [Rhizobium leguminosarum]|uniref:hypothetical protein n=1 Tax=Rhizobium leguminosarum TaxID=384 RepID=UPI000FEC3609|nr:hypothetical protein [Rhizobium leguminosarum]RWX22160.1 hypothetical protein EHH54_39395 [Rhizobium leguminosarum]